MIKWTLSQHNPSRVFWMYVIYLRGDVAAAAAAAVEVGDEAS